MKLCSKCSNLLHIHCFAKDASKKDGLYSSCKTCRQKYDKTHYIKNCDSYKKRSVIQRLVKRKELNQYKYKYRSKHKAYYAKHTKNYYDRKNIATPTWLSLDDVSMIKLFYFTAKIKTKQTKILHVVDHIIPIRGDSVSGLHVPWNLQIITMQQNSEKSNNL